MRTDGARAARGRAPLNQRDSDRVARGYRQGLTSGARRDQCGETADKREWRRRMTGRIRTAGERQQETRRTGSRIDAEQESEERQRRV